MERFIVITGGPGSGKSTLIDALAANGVRTMPEAGRATIRDQIATGGDALPWENPLAFAEQMLRRDLLSWREAATGVGNVLFDRGIPDILGYLSLCGIPAPLHITRAAGRFRYNRLVFIAPPWREIYAPDAERRQSWAEAEVTCQAMARVYTDLGYCLVWLPIAPVDVRADFVTERIRTD